MQTISIYEPIQHGLAQVEDNLRNVASRRFPFLAKMLEHVFETEGKRLRPAVTLLASNFNRHDNEKSRIMATAVELLHIATLIHDDTVDDSHFRRGRPTLSSLWGRNAAVLVGDFIFASSATYVCDTGNIRVIRRYSETIMELSSGELREMADAYNCEQTMEHYFERIYDKTASLFATAGETGAVLSGASEEVVQTLKQYSRNVGMAFQVVDDILDLEGVEEEVGKPVGNDLSHGIMTLPAIIAMKRYPEGNPIPALFQQPEDQTHLEHVVDMIRGSSVIDESYAVADKFRLKALDALRTLPQNPSRDSLEGLVDYVLTRRR